MTFATEPTLNIDATPLAITAYFSGERREMLVILWCCALALVLAGALYAVAKDGFATGFGIVALLAALLLASTAAALLQRGPAQQARLVAAVAGAQAQQAIAAEATRMDAVIGNYKYYRYGAIGLSLLALLGAAITRNGAVNGAAAGLLLLAAAQMAVDHYSEHRARGYAGQLGAWAPPGQAQGSAGRH